MDSIHVTNYELNIGLGLKMALVTDMHSMPYDDLLMLLQKKAPMRFSLPVIHWNATRKERASGVFYRWNSGSFCQR